jgi:cell division transport system permease protein
MSAWLLGHHRALVLAMRRLAAAPINSALSTLAIGIALALPAAGHVLLANAGALSAGMAGPAQISVFMNVRADARAVADTQRQLRSHPGIKALRSISRQETLDRMRAKEGLAEVIDMLPANPFPDAFVISPGDDRPQAMETLAAELRKLPQVEHVQLDSAWARRLEAAMRLARTLVVALAALLGLGLVAIAFNTIRLQILGGRAEIEVSRLLGATDGYIGRPFQYFGFVQGLAGGAAAWLMVAATIGALQTPVADLARAYGIDFALRPMQTDESGLLLIGASLLGWLGASLSLRQYLRAG